MTTPQPYRPNIGSAHEKLVIELTKKINTGALSTWQEIDVVRYAIEEAYKRAFPDQALPAEVVKLHKNYYADVDL